MSRLRNVSGSRDVIAESRFCVNGPEKYKGQWSSLFGNDAPIHIEIGMGKGRFLMRQAMLNPDINYIGIEMYSSVLVRAVQKAEETAAAGMDTGNFRFIRMDANGLAAVFAPGEIKKIYLNFSDPWPKERHAKRRLTSSGFLKLYWSLLPEGAAVEFKTDNTELFDFSLEEIKESDWTLTAHTYDLYSDPEMLEGNVRTEYEEKFTAKGNKICKLVITKAVLHGTEH